MMRAAVFALCISTGMLCWLGASPALTEEARTSVTQLWSERHQLDERQRFDISAPPRILLGPFTASFTVRRDDTPVTPFNNHADEQEFTMNLSPAQEQRGWHFGLTGNWVKHSDSVHFFPTTRRPENPYRIDPESQSKKRVAVFFRRVF